MRKIEIDKEYGCLSCDCGQCDKCESPINCDTCADRGKRKPECALRDGIQVYINNEPIG